jgi:hypothetical protein
MLSNSMRQRRLSMELMINHPKKAFVNLTKDLPEIRATRRARGVLSAEKRVEIYCHNVILDTVVLSISNRFSDHKELYNEIACFDPNRFKRLSP